MKLNYHIVLVRPIYPSNIGFSARAAANMGATSLTVISENASHLVEESKQRAAGAQEMLRGLHHFNSWEEFYANSGEGLRVAFTRRAGKIREVPLWNDLVKEIPNEQMLEDKTKDVFLFFGPEDHGLSADDLHNMHQHAQLPIYGEMGSLNLGHAVLLAAYIFQDNKKADLQLSHSNIDTSGAIVFDDRSLKEWLKCLGMENFDGNKSAATALHKMILRATPSHREWDIWQKVTHSTVRLLKNLKPEDRYQNNR